jgi:hypothetical protein
MKDVHKLIKATLVALLLLSPTKKVEAETTAEVMAGSSATTLDVRSFGELGEKKSAFLWYRGTVGYDAPQTPTQFMLADLTYSFADGIDALVEGQIVDGVGFVPRVGAQYLTKIGDITLLGVGTVGLEKDIEGLLSVTYTQKKCGSVHPIVKTEVVINAGLERLNFSEERLRAGVKIGPYTLSLGVDLGQYVSDTTKNVGLALSIDL